MASKLLYIHGFASCGVGNKSTALKRYFGEAHVIAPDLPYDPKQAVEFLTRVIQNESVRFLVGSSLGGFYAAYLAERFKLQAVLINPSVRPYETLAPYVGENERFCDGERFIFQASYLDTLRRMQIAPEQGSYLVLLQTADEVLDYRIAEAFFAKHRVIVERGGNHRFENLEDYLCMIERFFVKGT